MIQEEMEVHVIRFIMVSMCKVLYALKMKNIKVMKCYKTSINAIKNDDIVYNVYMYYLTICVDVISGDCARNKQCF